MVPEEDVLGPRQEMFNERKLEEHDAAPDQSAHGAAVPDHVLHGAAPDDLEQSAHNLCRIHRGLWGEQEGSGGGWRHALWSGRSSR